ncbi:MAG: hypothetical protein VB089_03955, partial [Anaerolineaceae bacterium]|nr:hypothetical protein [Anaerolineaceae bacterium]
FDFPRQDAPAEAGPPEEEAPAAVEPVSAAPAEIELPAPALFPNAAREPSPEPPAEPALPEAGLFDFDSSPPVPLFAPEVVAAPVEEEAQADEGVEDALAPPQASPAPADGESQVRRTSRRVGRPDLSAARVMKASQGDFLDKRDEPL